MPEKSVGSVSARLSVWFSLRRRAAKASARRLERLEAAGVEGGERGAPRDDPHPRALLRARLGEEKSPVVEEKREKTDFLWNGKRGVAGPPSKAPRDHEVQNEEKVAVALLVRIPLFTFKEKYEALPQPGHPSQRSALDRGERRCDGPQDERAREAHLPQRLPLQEALEVLGVDDDVRKLRHPGRLPRACAARE